MRPEDAIGGLLIAISSGVVLGIATLLIIYKMVDGTLPAVAGFPAIVMMLLCIALAVHPPHPVVPGVILVCALSLMAFFPFAEGKIEEFELRAIDADRMARSFEAIRVRPDNYAAGFDLARQMYALGFGAQAIYLSHQTLEKLDTQRDEVKNRSLRDLFHNDEILLKKWQGQQQDVQALKCPNCGTYNQPSTLLCTKCGRPYVLDIVQNQELKPRVWGKLVVGWAAIALLIPVAASIAMNLTGVAQSAVFVLALAVVGGLLYWLFRPPAYVVERTPDYS